jgi:predicted xylan-binding protein with Ca-dependent carbohydrate-binding module
MQTLFFDPSLEFSSAGEASMNSSVKLHVTLGLVLTGAIWAMAVPGQAAAADGDAIKVDLKSFKFKVPEAQAELFGYDEGESKLFFYTAGPGEATVKLPADGEYEIAIRASCTSALNERAKFKVTLDDEPVGKETLLTDDDEKEYKLTATAKAGERKLSIAFTNDAYKEGEYDRNFFVHKVTVQKVK